MGFKEMFQEKFIKDVEMLKSQSDGNENDTSDEIIADDEIRKILVEAYDLCVLVDRFLCGGQNEGDLKARTLVAYELHKASNALFFAIRKKLGWKTIFDIRDKNDKENENA